MQTPRTADKEMLLACASRGGSSADRGAANERDLSGRLASCWVCCRSCDDDEALAAMHEGREMDGRDCGYRSRESRMLVVKRSTCTATVDSIDGGRVCLCSLHAVWWFVRKENTASRGMGAESQPRSY